MRVTPKYEYQRLIQQYITVAVLKTPSQEQKRDFPCCVILRAHEEVGFCEASDQLRHYCDICGTPTIGERYMVESYYT